MSDLTYRSLPAVVRSYFDRTDLSADTFTEDASVTDDGRSYRGRDEIAAWLHGAASAFDYSTTFLGAQRDGDVVTVASRLEGSFPGGTVELTFRFRVDGAHIAELVIAA